MLGYEVSPEAGLKEAWRAALASPDLSTQNGGVLFGWDGRRIASACNTLPAGIRWTAARLERPLKYDVTEHAERNTIFAAARSGWPTDGSTLYCGWAACADCARAIIQAGIIRLVRDGRASELAAKAARAAADAAQKVWSESISIADQMLKEAGVEVIDYFAPGQLQLLDGQELLLSGERWKP